MPGAGLRRGVVLRVWVRPALGTLRRRISGWSRGWGWPCCVQKGGPRLRTCFLGWSEWVPVEGHTHWPGAVLFVLGWPPSYPPGRRPGRPCHTPSQGWSPSVRGSAGSWAHPPARHCRHTAKRCSNQLLLPLHPPSRIKEQRQAYSPPHTHTTAARASLPPAHTAESSTSSSQPTLKAASTRSSPWQPWDRPCSPHSPGQPGLWPAQRGAGSAPNTSRRRPSCSQR